LGRGGKLELVEPSGRIDCYADGNTDVEIFKSDGVISAIENFSKSFSTEAREGVR